MTGAIANTNHRRAFSLVEAAVVVCALATVAMIAGPRLGVAGPIHRDAQLRDELERLRRAIALYAAQHRGAPPGFAGGDIAAAPSFDALRTQLTGWTDRGGTPVDPSDGRRALGPYLMRMPTNPISGLGSVRFMGPSPRDRWVAGGEHGWVYQPSTLLAAPDTPGADARGVEYIDY